MDPTAKVPSALIPAREFMLLLPNAAVAEVFTTSDIKLKKTPQWLAGMLRWRDHTISVIAFDCLAKSHPIQLGEKPLIAVVRVPQVGSEAFIGILSSDTPDLVIATTRTLESDLQPTNLHPYALSYARINGQPVIIPDLPKLYKKVAKFQT